MSQFAINVPRYISPLEAIRSALGDLGYGNLMQTLEPDLIRWCVESQDLISRAKTLKWVEEDLVVEDNKIMPCAAMQMIECVSQNGNAFTYDPTRSCANRCTANCATIYVYPNYLCEQRYTLDECYIHFDPLISDGQTIHVKGVVRPMDDNGYPIINDLCVVAIQEYVKWKICFRYRDDRKRECEQRWYYLCRSARAAMQKYSQQQLQNIGLMWYAPRVHLNNYLGYAGDYNYAPYY